MRYKFEKMLECNTDWPEEQKGGQNAKAMNWYSLKKIPSWDSKAFAVLFTLKLKKTLFRWLLKTVSVIL